MAGNNKSKESDPGSAVGNFLANLFSWLFIIGAGIAVILGITWFIPNMSWGALIFVHQFLDQNTAMSFQTVQLLMTTAFTVFCGIAIPATMDNLWLDDARKKKKKIEGGDYFMFYSWCLIFAILTNIGLYRYLSQAEQAGLPGTLIAAIAQLGVILLMMQMDSDTTRGIRRLTSWFTGPFAWMINKWGRRGAWVIEAHDDPDFDVILNPDAELKEVRTQNPRKR